MYRFKRLYKIPKCPDCGGELLRETTDYEMQANEEWVICEDCDYTSDFLPEHEPLRLWFGFGEQIVRRNSKTHRRRRMLVSGR